MIFPVEEVCGGKGLIEKYQSSSLYLAFLVIIHGILGFPQGHLQGSWCLRRGGILLVIGQMLSIKWEMWGEHWWTQSMFRVHRIQGDHGS
jgi:hypothetical protein